MEGHIHSTETFGTVDGPGIRFVVFLQGCPMRCAYCHNPDTWDPSAGTLRTVEDVMKEFDSLKYNYTSGGLTVTGGEPLLQIDFVTELFEACKKRGVHTCIDSSGITFNRKSPEVLAKMDKLMTITDLVMLDIKHMDPEGHIKLCQQKNDNILDFARYLSEKQVDVWIRRVVVPGITDQEPELRQLGEFLAELHNIKALDVLPYHTMGTVKYKKLGIPYPLEGVPAESKEEAIRCRNVIIDAWKKKKAELNAAQNA